VRHSFKAGEISLDVRIVNIVDSRLGRRGARSAWGRPFVSHFF